MTKLIYKKLCFKIVGVLYNVFNQIGGGHRESFYHKAIGVELEDKKIKFESELYHPIYYKEKLIGKIYLDFLIENKVVLEIKRGEIFKPQDIKQVYEYLISKNLKLGILANFTKNKVRYKRILNLK